MVIKHDYISVEQRYPEHNQHVQIYFKCEGEIRVTRGLFTMFGGKKEFNSYGSVIPNVVGWLPYGNNS